DVEIDNNDFDLDGKDEITVKITFKIDPEELTEGNTDYSIYVSAEGTIDDSDAPDEIDGDKTGIDNEETIEIVTDDDFVIIDDIQIQPNPASCEGTIEITADVWNVGDEDLEDDEVYVWVYNKELEINKIIEFDSGIDAMDYEKIELSLEIPEELEEKTYAIRFVAYDDKDMDEKDIFETKDEDDASFYGTLEVSGNCNVKPQIDIKAELQSGGQAGKPLIVKSTLKNIGEESSSYEIILEGYEAWAELDEISSDVIILDKQESKDILITLDVNKDALGDKSFNIKIVSDGEVVIQQPVSVTIEKSGFSFPITGNIISEGNWYLWGIGALNVLLVVVIIIVAFKVARKK
ncbi:MAG: putative S-layer protein, partial [Nanoarchaeota archaeon]